MPLQVEYKYGTKPLKERILECTSNPWADRLCIAINPVEQEIGKYKHVIRHGDSRILLTLPGSMRLASETDTSSPKIPGIIARWNMARDQSNDARMVMVQVLSGHSGPHSFGPAEARIITFGKIAVIQTNGWEIRPEPNTHDTFRIPVESKFSIAPLSHEPLTVNLIVLAPKPVAAKQPRRLQTVS